MFLISDCKEAHKLPQASLTDLIIGTIKLPYCVEPKIWLNRNTKYTPAETNVANCIKNDAETRDST